MHIEENMSIAGTLIQIEWEGTKLQSITVNVDEHLFEVGDDFHIAENQQREFLRLITNVVSTAELHDRERRDEKPCRFNARRHMATTDEQFKRIREEMIASGYYDDKPLDSMHPDWKPELDSTYMEALAEYEACTKE